MSVKFQITLPDDLASAMKRAAAQQRIPLALLIRETMEIKLRELNSHSQKDPFASIDGIADIDETDLSSRVDEILYE
jgi:hypothetical protein